MMGGGEGGEVSNEPPVLKNYIQLPVLFGLRTNNSYNCLKNE